MEVSAQEQPSVSNQITTNTPPFPLWSSLTHAPQTGEQKVARPQTQRHPQAFLFVAMALFMLIMGCSASDLLTRPTATPEPPRALAPTFTSTPATVVSIVIVTPPHDGTPGVIIIPPGMDPSKVIPASPTPTPVPPTLMPGETRVPGQQPASPLILVPTATPLPTFTPTPTLTPTPFIAVDSGVVSLRGGPGVQYPLVAQLGPNLAVALTGRTPDGAWYQICCVNGASVWVAANHVHVYNDPNSVVLVIADASPPAPTPTIPPTPTGTATPTATATRFPFERARGPEFYPTNNPFLVIWAKFYVGAPGGPEDQEVATAGYFLKVKFQGTDRQNTNVESPSAEQFSFSASPGASNRVRYNYKYEYTPPLPTPPPPPAATPDPVQARLNLLGTGVWTIYVVDGAGNQLSDAVTFETSPGNPNREIYIAWIRTR
ncbi:MAG: SH3 domain-containing protein [Chloroflexi bacterium]|nr:SH3 domain-containing protein [Chloroflexota bacterium]